MQAGISASTPAAIICPKSTENFETKVSRPTGKVVCVVAGDQHQREQQLAPGRGEDEAERRGDARQRQRQDDLAQRAEARAPSIIAASSRSFGMPSKKDCIRKVAKGMLKAV